MCDNFPGKIGILGGGTWATALAKILLVQEKHLAWFMRRQDQIDDFIRLGHNPSYLPNVEFNVDRISFYTDINQIVDQSDTLVLAIPSPFLKEHLSKLTVDISNKFIVSAIKGIIPPENLLVTDFLIEHYKIAPDNIAIIGGPCHAEEVAMERLTYPTIACKDLVKADAIANVFRNRFINPSVSTDVDGIELGAVLKNVYAIMCGISHGLKYGDNFQAVLVSNAVDEMERFINIVYPEQRKIYDSAYLGDLLVTAYSSFSRNRTFGTMVGKGYSVKAAQIEMEMIAEGYYGTKCIMEINQKYRVPIPIVEAAYNILYMSKPARQEVKRMREQILR